MRRREFITTLGSAAVWPVIARAQQPAQMKRIAMVDPSESVADITVTGKWWYRVFFQELSRLGYVEGRNLLVGRYSGEGRTELYEGLVGDVASTHPDLIFTFAPLALRFKTATTIIPIVALTSDPIAMKLVTNIARPGGNITGVSIDGGLEIHGKRIGLLIEALPKLSNLGYLASRGNWERASGSAAAREAATKAGISLTGELLDRFNEQEYQRVFETMERDRVDGLIVSDEGEHITFMTTIVELAAKTRIPAIYPYGPDFIKAGGLMSYSLSYKEVWRRLASVIGQILNGASPGDIPFYQETKFELSINLKTAKALGLELAKDTARRRGRGDRIEYSCCDRMVR